MPADIHQMMKDLIAVFDSKPQPPPTNVSAAIKIAPALPQTQMYKAFTEYLGPTLPHLVSQKDDTILVYGSAEAEQVFIGYNTRTQLGGRFPARAVEWVSSGTKIEDELVVGAVKSGFKNGVDGLNYDKGDYIRSCRWFNPGHDGYGLNQRTLGLEAFPKYGVKKISW